MKSVGARTGQIKNERREGDVQSCTRSESVVVSAEPAIGVLMSTRWSEKRPTMRSAAQRVASRQMVAATPPSLVTRATPAAIAPEIADKGQPRVAARRRSTPHRPFRCSGNSGFRDRPKPVSSRDRRPPTKSLELGGGDRYSVRIKSIREWVTRELDAWSWRRSYLSLWEAYPFPSLHSDARAIASAEASPREGRGQRPKRREMIARPLLRRPRPPTGEPLRRVGDDGRVVLPRRGV